MPVAEFVPEREARMNVAEALSVIKNWNPSWIPEFVMTDRSDVEIKALKQIFPQAQNLLCAFHREQAWDRWLKDGMYFKKAFLDNQLTFLFDV